MTSRGVHGSIETSYKRPIGVSFEKLRLKVRIMFLGSNLVLMNKAPRDKHRPTVACSPRRLISSARRLSLL
jgi:hypothetical protein